LEGLAMEDLGIGILWPFGQFFYHLVNFLPFDIFYGVFGGHSVYFPRFGMFY
jgi:hypothetical protein